MTEDGGKTWGPGADPAPTPAEFIELSPTDLAEDLDSFIVAALDAAQALSRQKPSRELSLVITKLEEVEMWNEKRRGGESK